MIFLDIYISEASSKGRAERKLDVTLVSDLSLFCKKLIAASDRFLKYADCQVPTSSKAPSRVTLAVMASLNNL